MISQGTRISNNIPLVSRKKDVSFILFKKAIVIKSLFWIEHNCIPVLAFSITFAIMRYYQISRGNCPEVFKKVLVTLSKEKLRHRCFHVNFAKFYNAAFLQNISERLFLNQLHVVFFHQLYWSIQRLIRTIFIVRLRINKRILWWVESPLCGPRNYCISSNKRCTGRLLQNRSWKRGHLIEGVRLFQNW